MNDIFGNPVSSDLSEKFVYRKKYNDVIEMYETHESTFWTVHDLDLTHDREHFETYLTKDEQHFILYVLAFFAASDGIVTENLIERFSIEINIPDVKHFYGFQLMMENIHSKTYTLLLEQIVENEVEREKLFRSIDNIDCIRNKGLWCLQWIYDKNATLTKRLFAYALVEGVFFSASFCSIFWIKKRGIMPGLTLSNEFISRDENLHSKFSCLMYNKITQADNSLRLSDEEVYEIVEDAVSVEKLFVDECLPNNLNGMNKELMYKHVEKCADIILQQTNYKVLYNAETPFDFMDMCSIIGKNNFFERRVSEYNRVPAKSSSNEQTTFISIAYDEDFDSCF